ncbi:MAG: hypothetical protein RIS94_315 [Pseudomonadota bacterium]|jgi:predicted dehydrogenase
MARIALIGAGRMGFRFLQAIRKAGHEVAVIYDLAETPFAVSSDPQLARLHVRDLAAVAASGADATAICTTADSHVPLARQLIAMGQRRLIIEKPLSQSVADAEALAALAQAQGVRIVVNHGRRYCANTERLKALDGGEDTGRLRSVVIKMGGGALGCVGTHWIDLCNNLLGGVPQQVFARLSPETPGNNRGAQFFDPGGSALLFYAGGRRAILDLGDDVGIVGGADFIFERGMVSWTSEGGAWTYAHRREEDRARPLTLYGLPLVAGAFDAVPPDLIDYAAAAVNDAFATGEVRSGIDLAVETMTTFAAIRRSAALGLPVCLPLDDAAKTEIYRIP